MAQRDRDIDPADLLAGDQRVLARAITLIESTRADHRAQAEALLSAVAGRRSARLRLGISGAPGVGKSTFIEAFGQHLTGLGLSLAVLAVDPSSQRSGGSILGDKTRMAELSRDPRAFIRPSPSGGGLLGGVARRTHDVLSLVEAAGFDVVIVETVGVGQSETTVADMVDLFLLLLSPGGGDDLQGIKRGVMELADLVVVNKADGDLLTAARHAAADHRAALALMRPRLPGWQAEVLMASALKGEGLDEIWQAAERFRAGILESGLFERQRADQARRWLWREIEAQLTERLRGDDAVARRLDGIEQRVASGAITPGAGARDILDHYLGPRDAPS